MTVKSIRINGKLVEADIDFSKVYRTSAQAMNGDTNKAIKGVKEQYWGDNEELVFDEKTGLVKEGKYAMGFINPDDIKPISENNNLNNNKVLEQPINNNEKIKKINDNSLQFEEEFINSLVVDQEEKTSQIVDKLSRREVNLTKIQASYDKARAKNNGNGFKKKCARLAVYQLYNKGLLIDDSIGNANDLYWNIKNYVSNDQEIYQVCFNNKGKKQNRLNASSKLDEIIADGNGRVDNLLVTLNGGGWNSQYGHAVLINTIENGNVYFTDNTKNTHQNPPEMPVETFKQKYFNHASKIYLTQFL